MRQPPKFLRVIYILMFRNPGVLMVLGSFLTLFGLGLFLAVFTPVPRSIETKDIVIAYPYVVKPGQEVAVIIRARSESTRFAVREASKIATITGSRVLSEHPLRMEFKVMVALPRPLDLRWKLLEVDSDGEKKRRITIDVLVNSLSATIQTLISLITSFPGVALVRLAFKRLRLT